MEKISGIWNKPLECWNNPIKNIYYTIDNNNVKNKINELLNKTNWLSYKYTKHVNHNIFDSKYVMVEAKNQFNNMLHKIGFHYGSSMIIFWYNTFKELQMILLILPYLINLHEYFGKINLIAYVVFTDLKKELSDENKLSPSNINSGYTSFGEDQFLVVWRKEEWVKVFIHEMIHYFNMDGQLKRANNKREFDKWCIKSSRILINEAITDTWAIIISASLYSYIHNKPFKNVIANETDHIFKQAKKILKKFNFNNVREMSNHCTNYLIQDTWAFSYYIVKAGIFYNINTYLHEYYQDKNIHNPKSFDTLIDTIQFWLLDEKFNNMLENLKINDSLSLTMSKSDYNKNILFLLNKRDR
jgi:hypothetical protein